MAQWHLPAELVLWITHLSQPLHARLAWRLLPLITVMLFARGRRTVASWLRGAGLGADFRAYYYFLGSLGRNVSFIAALLLRRAIAVIAPGERVLLALDHTPTQRYGRHVEAAGRPEVPVRPHLGDARLVGTASALGGHRLAPAGLAQRPPKADRPGAPAVRRVLPDQAGDGRRPGRVGRRLAAVCGEKAGGGRRRCLRQAAVPAAGPGRRCDGGQPLAQGCRPVEPARGAAARAAQEARPQAQVRHHGD